MIVENTEWTSTWMVSTGDSVLPRVLDVGDSISNGYRETVNAHTDGKFLVNTIATSSALDNPLLLQQIALMWTNSARYNLIHFNNGLHGWHLDAENYARLYEQTVVTLLKTHPDCPLMLVTSTPRYTGDTVHRLLDGQNDIVLERNAVVQRVAQKFRLPVDDLYTSALAHLQEWASGDGYHYNSTGWDGLGTMVAAAERRQLGL